MSCVLLRVCILVFHLSALFPCLPAPHPIALPLPQRFFVKRLCAVCLSAVKRALHTFRRTVSAIFFLHPSQLHIRRESQKP